VPPILDLTVFEGGKTLVVADSGQSLDEKRLGELLDLIGEDDSPVRDILIVRIGDKNALPKLPEFFALLHKKKVKEFVVHLNFK
jgi:hypothetical protein